MRKRWMLIGGLALGVVAGVVGVVGWALFQVPAFYKQASAAVRNPTERKAAAESFMQKTTRLADDIKYSNRWSQTFTELQVNSWLAEELPVHYAKHVPRGVSEPRVHIEDGTLLIGFRYDQGRYEGVVSVRLRPTVPSDNRLAVEIETVRAGLVPISVDGVLEEITRRLIRAGWPVEWNQTDDGGNDVAIVSLDRGGSHRAVLESVEVRDGTVRIGGRRTPRTEGSPQTAYLQARRPSSASAE